MLCQFTVKNFRSIRDEATLDMQAASISEHEDSLLIDEDGAKFLPVAVLYGPNGGGKTTVLEALNSLIWKVIRPILSALYDDSEESFGKSQPASIKPFLFDSISRNQPTEFEVFFRTDSTEYRYQLHIINDKIVFESLFRKKIEGYRYSEVFTRKNSTGIEMKGSLRSYKASGLTDTLPLLSYLGIAHQNNLLVKDAISWFLSEIGVVNYLIPKTSGSIALPNTVEKKELLLKIFKEMDIDISDFRDEKLLDERIKVYTTHSVEGNVYELDLIEESSGTKKIFGVMPFIIDSIQYGLTLIFDELDVKLHPVLLKYIISMYVDPAINRNKAQLLFTSHDLSTMSNELFRRDEIWFVAKDKSQATKVYSLVEFKDDNGKTPRKDAVYGKQYLEGRYGADPYLKKIINWEDEI